ncbi:alpha-galactosidase [Pedosphaera parvula]|uniref:alpha-galactosidase n=1 Tax=Pedosphaera parvula (strain Ellin514) TaxID=320771 RepID=B9XJ49_PEDPL|nr:alpha-galactosidase [Pedosphaera parvula]EEF60087.1 glycoside hydrolase clan GH-D [Pedosphaera parvula Ellin514]
MQIKSSVSKSVALVLLLISSGSYSFAETVRLSSLDLSLMTCGWSVPKVDTGIVGRPLSIGSKEFSYGVGTHAESNLRIDLGGNATRFRAQVGVDDSAGTQGSVEFIVIGDKKVLWKSGVVRGAQAPTKVDVDISGVRTLGLRVTDGGDGSGNDHADWAEANIAMNDGAPKPKALPPKEIISLKTAHFSLDFEVGEDGRLYQNALGLSGGKVERSDEAYPQAGDGYIWEPALQVVHADGNTSTALLFDTVTQNHETTNRDLVRIKLHDPAYPFEVALCFRVHRDKDVIEQWSEIIHHETNSVQLERMASTSLNFASTNLFLTHFAGDWAKEMLSPITEQLTPGTKILDSKIGVRADQFGNPSFILSLDGPPSETAGRVLAGSLAWSGSFQCAFDDNNQGVRALCGINPFASTYHLKSGETFVTPTMIWTWSNHGLGEMSRKLHAWARDFGMRDGHETRAVLLNNWEATEFNFDFKRIVGLYDPAKEIGSELFLLDDGWFGNKYPRVNDHAGLGDWQPNRKRLPEGLAPLASEAAKRGLRFGIWIEPEMVNPQSELFDNHPDWVISQPKRPLELQRNQLVLDLTRPQVQQFEWKVIQDILSVPGITYAKWDCNRYLTQPGSSYLAPDRQSHLWIDYVRALYALMEKTARAFPNTELMLCSGGGGRVDYAALKYFHEFWPSDNTDSTVRVPMQWDFSYFFPPMATASHVTHSGNRPMHFACSVAMSARFGMDLDLTSLPPADKAVCAGAISAYKRIRDVTQLGDLYRLENPHEGMRGALDFVSPDQSRAVVFVFQLKDGQNTAVRPQGLDPAKRYLIREINPASGRAAIPQEGKTFTGEELMRQGMLPSCTRAVEACVIELGS